MKSLNSESLKIVGSLYETRPLFRQNLDRLLQDEAKSAVELTDRLQKILAAETPEAPKPTKKAVKKTGTGKRGRPAGSKNRPKAPKVEGEVTETADVAEAKLTHGQVIAEVLQASPDGLTAAQILEAISKSNHENYNAPSKATLQTTLVGLRDKKVIKAKGQRPNTRYFIK